MPRDPVTGHLSVSTLGDLQDGGDQLNFWCIRCGRDLDLDLAKAIELWGRDRRYIDQRWNVKCSQCNSRDIGVIVRPGAYKDQKWGTPQT